MSAHRRAAGYIARGALIAAVALLLVALTGCALVRTTAPSAVPGSPAASGPDQNPFLPSEVLPLDQVPKAGKVASPSVGAYLGVFSPPAPFDVTQLSHHAKITGKDVSIVMWFQPWARTNRSEFDGAACLAVLRRGAVPMITWEPWDPGNNSNNLANPADQPEYSLQRIVAGDYDSYIRTFATRVAAFGGPVMLRPLHEMNGTWYPWGGTVNGNSPALYIAAWRRIHAIFDKAGASNVTWVWSVNAESVPNTPKNSWPSYYPGDQYVDWVSISSFNWGTSKPGERWRTWTAPTTPVLTYLATLHKPICISETGCVEQGGSKAAWLTQTYASIAKVHDIAAVVYFDSLEAGPQYSQDWRIDSTPASLEAFAAAIAPPYYVSTPPAAVTDWASKLTRSDWTYLSSIKPVY